MNGPLLSYYLRVRLAEMPGRDLGLRHANTY